MHETVSQDSPKRSPGAVNWKLWIWITAAPLQALHPGPTNTAIVTKGRSVSSSFLVFHPKNISVSQPQQEVNKQRHQSWSDMRFELFLVSAKAGNRNIKRDQWIVCFERVSKELPSEKSLSVDVDSIFPSSNTNVSRLCLKESDHRHKRKHHHSEPVNGRGWDEREKKYCNGRKTQHTQL